MGHLARIRWMPCTPTNKARTCQRATSRTRHWSKPLPTAWPDPQHRRDPMATTYPRATRAVALIVALSLSACASRPIVQWQAPERKSTPQLQTLDYAYSYADAARTVYQKAIVDQLKESTDLSGALVAAGALTAALAMSSGVSRDAVAGVAVLGGTSY